MGRSWWGHVKRGARIAPQVYGGVAMFIAGLWVGAWVWETGPGYVVAVMAILWLVLCLPLMLAQASRDTPEDECQDGDAS